MAAGLVMAIAKATFSTALDLDPSPPRVAELLNRAIWRTGNQRTFLSAFYGLLTPETGEIEWVCAGHPFPLVLREGEGNGSHVEEIGVGGLPFGLRESLDAPCGRTTLAPGETLVLYTDGLPEGVDSRFEAFGFPRIAALVAGGDVTHFQLTSDSAYVVFRADPSVDQTFDLFRVPLGGGAALALTALPAGRGVQIDFALTASGQQVLLRANPNGVARYELFRVPADGSASPLQLSGTLVAGGSVSSFALAPDQQRVVYLADERSDNVLELSSVPLAGGASVLLHALSLGDVTTFRIAADSSRVVTRADANFPLPRPRSTLTERSLLA